MEVTIPILSKAAIKPKSLLCVLPQARARSFVLRYFGTVTPISLSI